MKTLWTFLLSFFVGSCSNNDSQREAKVDSANLAPEEVVMNLATFFEGNNEIGSIGANLDPEVKPSEFYSLFKQIESSPKTEKIYVRIADEEEGEWPYSDAVYIIGDWTKAELSELVKKLHPDEIQEGWMYPMPKNIPEPKNKVFTLWWD